MPTLPKRLIILFLLFTALLRAELDSLFNEDEDPTLFHHVNVITGNLNLCMQDARVQGPTPQLIQRTYTSAGVFEQFPMSDLPCGWSLFPHKQLVIESASSEKNYKIYIPQKSGGIIQYVYSHKEDKHTTIFKPKCDLFQCSGKISARTNPGNNRLRIDFDQGSATLLLPDGGYWIYKGQRVDHHKQPYHTFILEMEVLPNQHLINYTYNKKKHLKAIAYRSPGHDAYSLIQIINNQNTPYAFTINTSDGQTISYQAQSHQKRNYLHEIKSPFLPTEKIHYEERRGDNRARVTRIEREGHILFDVTYNQPSEHNKKKNHEDFPADRVSCLKAPIGPDGSLVAIASFTYQPNHTDVRDVQNILTRYHHDSNRLTEIEYFDENDTLASVIKFIWQGSRLQGKVKLDGVRSPLFSKTFKHDAVGNVTEEFFWGNLTGNAPGPYTLNPDGSLTGAESYTKRYRYLPTYNVPVLEEEEGGLTYHYTYKEKTNLLTSKLTTYNGKILTRTFYQYDSRFLLIAEIIDDGATADPQDTYTLTERHITQYTYEPETGLVKTQTELYLDRPSHKEVPLKTTAFTYDAHHHVQTQTVFDAASRKSYTLHSTYDAHGNLTSQTNPIGQENTYRYDPLGKLTTSSEIGKPTKTITYDHAGNPASCIETDHRGRQKTVYTTYDAKGRLVSHTDTKGNTTTQHFNAFGECFQTHLPELRDETGSPYTPIIHFSYDANGNIATTTTPQGETTHTTYNALRKPLCITPPDGSRILYTYNKDGTLATTTYPDTTTTHTTYDPFQRKLTETTLSSNGDLLKQETWTYSAFHPTSHTDPLGLTTHITYDSAGRKILERALDREKTYTYDALNFLETTTTAQKSHIERHDPLGRVIEEWDLLLDTSIENHMSFTYDQNNRKKQAIRRTAQGNAIDTFTHDIRGLLLTHTDPDHHTTTFHYDEDHLNDLNQQVLQKTTIDPLGNRTVETYDALDHLLLKERQSPAQDTLAKEEYTYDRDGNQIRRTTTIYHDSTPVKTYDIAWTYDSRGRVISETESDQKTTLYTYDSKGRIIQKILPNTTALNYTYDGIDRLLTLTGSDGTVDYQYTYTSGDNPTRIDDPINHLTLLRSYNPFGELTQELNPYQLHTIWTYDNTGRCTHLALPSDTHITYTYSGPHLITATLTTPTHTCRHHYTHFDENGHVTQEELISNLGTLTTTHDLLERPTTQTSPYHTHTTTYGPSGLITHTQNTLLGDKEYTYDPLNQLLTAGTDTYHFDSLGNPTSAQTNDFNQILSTPDTTLTYDPCGNPLARTTPTTQTTYTYDALGRLLTLTDQTGTTHFTYDPFSRLISTTTPTQTELYLYDQEHDIGTLNPDHTLKNLKLLGLGLKGDIGATLAILTQDTLYAPLHDTSGNIIALIAPDHTLAETYHFDPFGKEPPTPTINPWHYNSKRTLHGLIYFGLRFYDPTLARFLTPDPSGFTDSPNLYLFVLNSPLNRLDLFGLSSSPITANDFRVEFILPPFPEIQTLLVGKAHGTGFSVDLIAHCKSLHLLQYPPEELGVGKIALDSFLKAQISSEGRFIGLITFSNGIKTSLENLQQNVQSIINLNSSETPVISFHTPTHGIFKDLNRVFKESNHVEVAAVARERQVLTFVSDALHKINPSALWLYIAHSDGCLRFNRAYEGMTPDQQKLLQQQIIIRAFGPAEPIPRAYALSAINFYSSKDYITCPLAKPFRKDPDYDIQIMKCISPRSTRILGLVDHNFLAPTYQQGVNRQLKRTDQDYGFYKGNVR